MTAIDVYKDLDVLLTTGGRVAERLTATQWALALGNGRPVPATVQVREGWITLSTPAPGAAKAPIDVLLQNALLPSGVKLTAVNAALEFRVDLALEDAALDRQFAHGCASLEASALGHPVAVPTAPAGGPALKDLCEAAGWPFVERSADRIAVELAVDDGFQQAVVERDASTPGVRVATHVLAADAPVSDICLRAAATLLLDVARKVYCVRAFALPAMPAITAGFEVCFDDLPTPAALQQAYATLSIACRLCAHELDALVRDEHLARLYLAFTHPGTTHHSKGEEEHAGSYDCPPGK